jgi:hypothetical protein
VAVLDTETNPFDAATEAKVYPFLAVLYFGDREPIIIWDNDWRQLVDKLVIAIRNLPGRYIIYAHNGGRFDYMFLVHHLRGEVIFKGRGLMSAKIGRHQLRDSFHILPEKLKNVGGKDDIDYALMLPAARNKPNNRRLIIDYCLADCRYLYDAVMAFRKRFGGPLTIGQAAIRELRRVYKRCENLDDETDHYLRSYFFGGRVECLRYGMVRGNFNLFDVNSMYPFVMSRRLHPIGREVYINDKIREGRTAFITLRCRNNGALVARAFDGSLTTSVREGIFNTTIYEYETAIRHNLISDIEIISTVEFRYFSDFSKFVDPIYAERQERKRELDDAIRVSDDARIKTLRYDVLFAKLLLNNAYGKFAQNPRRFRNYLITEPDWMPPVEWGEFPEVSENGYSIWSKPNPEFRFNNVGTAASITGAARAYLMDTMATARDILYCDTDSLICTDLGGNSFCDPYELGAWDREARISTFIGNGKKLYAYETMPDAKRVIKAKGCNAVTWQDMIDVSNGQEIAKIMAGPTLYKDGTQEYITRRIKQTGVYSPMAQV